MPRYNDVDTIVFTDVNGIPHSVKDIRPISEQTMAFEIDKNKYDLLDEVANRPSVFGAYGESKSWQIFDLNIVKLTEANFDLSRITRLKIPV